MKYQILSLFFLSFILSACGNNDDQPKKNEKEYTVSEYVANPELTKKTLLECDSKIASISDNEKIYSNGNCHNAKLASKEISKKRNEHSNKPKEVKIVY